MQSLIERYLVKEVSKKDRMCKTYLKLHKPYSTAFYNLRMLIAKDITYFIILINIWEFLLKKGCLFQFLIEY